MRKKFAINLVFFFGRKGAFCTIPEVVKTIDGIGSSRSISI